MAKPIHKTPILTAQDARNFAEDLRERQRLLKVKEQNRIAKALQSETK